MLDKVFKKSAYTEDQPNAYEILYVHCAIKGLQFGAIAGTIMGSLYALKTKNIATITSFANRGSLIMAPISTGMCFIKMRNEDEMGWKDRSWRLQRNKGQILVDNISLGPGLVTLLISRQWAGIGLAEGVLAGAIYNHLTAKMEGVAG